MTSCVQTKPYRSWGDMWNVLKTVLGNENLFLVRVYMNLYPFGAEALAHTDSDRDDEITALVPIHASWHHDWGGETVLIDRFGDVTRSVLPYPGRALVFRSNILHSARPVTRSCPLARRMLVFKAASWPAGQVLRARQPDMLDGAGPPAEPGPGVSTTFCRESTPSSGRKNRRNPRMRLTMVDGARDGLRQGGSSGCPGLWPGGDLALNA